MDNKRQFQRTRFASRVKVDHPLHGSAVFTTADVSDGGVVVALLEMALRSGVGARCWVPDELDPFVFLLSESATRAVVVVPRSEELRFTEMCRARRFACERIGVVDSGLGGVLQIGDIELSIAQMRERSAAVLPALFA